MEDFVSKRRTTTIFNITLRSFLAVMSSMMNSPSWASYKKEIRPFFPSKRKSRTLLNKAFILKRSLASFVLPIIYEFHASRDLFTQ